MRCLKSKQYDDAVYSLADKFFKLKIKEERWSDVSEDSELNKIVRELEDQENYGMSYSQCDCALRLSKIRKDTELQYNMPFGMRNGKAYYCIQIA